MKYIPMLKEAIQYVIENMRPEAKNLGNRAYIITQKGAQEVIVSLIGPDTVPLHSLDSIVKMIRTEAIHLADVNTPALFVNIPSPTNVVCFSQPDYEQRCHRTVFYSADATDVPGWEAKVTPSSVILRSLDKLNTWNPPLSVRMGPFQRVNLCRPPISATS